MIGPVVAATLPLMRAHAQSLMTDACTIERLTSGWDEALQKTVTTWTTVHAAVPCHVEEPAASSRSLLTDEAVTLEAPLVKVAHDVAGVEPDDRVTIAGRDPMWVTRAAHDDPSHPVELLILCRWAK